MSSGPGGGAHPNCNGCRHYFVTWEPARPHGCRAWGFKSSVSPSIEVFKCSGVQCQQFEERGRGAPANHRPRR
ncbi:MAG: uracil-DNA glycosylase [Candidatus Wallbacteria bacterium HGW-Wallbacteria-1]|uniref:Uracil-DNA glycosylase n=1 Tax=Candidatus Wallbacteria bacterium HGW-Wallbacteria-1 TaxID=2013854 RepID=A0A2N1PTZ2_9BACT|nr:MAG: uracil-DNA glycosylase [Candidatus Wallbacteria bacterium HGW-Wallbacteria-1]